MTSVKRLYGGAIHAYLPPNCCDISDVRQVPDNQEVFAHTSSDQSIIFDIMEYVTDMTDEKAIEHHFVDLVGNKNDCEVVAISKMDMNLPNCDGVYYLYGRSRVSKYKETAKNIVDIHLALFRYQKFATDILVTFNDPIVINPESSSFAATSTNESNQKWTLDDFKKTIQTFSVIDFSLFSA